MQPSCKKMSNRKKSQRINNALLGMIMNLNEIQDNPNTSGVRDLRSRGMGVAVGAESNGQRAGVGEVEGGMIQRRAQSDVVVRRKDREDMRERRKSQIRSQIVSMYQYVDWLSQQHLVCNNM